MWQAGQPFPISKCFGIIYSQIIWQAYWVSNAPATSKFVAHEDVTIRLAYTLWFPAAAVGVDRWNTMAMLKWLGGCLYSISWMLTLDTLPSSEVIMALNYSITITQANITQANITQTTLCQNNLCSKYPCRRLFEDGVIMGMKQYYCILLRAPWNNHVPWTFSRYLGACTPE